MPIVTREQALQNIEKFQNDICEFQSNQKLDLKSKNKISACQKKITRWKTYIKDMNDCGDDSFKYRFSGVSLTKTQALISGVQGGRPKIYSPEEIKDRIREQQRLYSIKYRLRLKELEIYT
jgi:D-mannonate dehydratase